MTPRSGFSSFFVLLGALALASAVSAQDAPKDSPAPIPAGTIAPPGRWNGERGNAAGTLRTAAMPILSGVEEAWSADLPGEAAGAPVLWDGTAYILCRDGKKRALFAFDLLTGERRARKVLSDGPMVAPVVADGLVIVMDDPDQLVAYRLRGDFLAQRWKPSLREAKYLSDPIVIDDEVYVLMNGTTLLRLRPRKRLPVWIAAEPHDFVGVPSAYGDHVFALHHAALAGYEPSLQVVTFDRRTGARTGGANVAWYVRGRMPAVAAGARVTVFPDRIFVTSTAPLASSAGGRSYATLPCQITRVGVRFMEGGGLHDLQAPPAWDPAGALFLSADEGKLGWDVRIKDKIWRVTSQDDQPDLFRHRLPATVFGRIAYFGWWAADLETDEVLWRLPVEDPKFAAVPADRMVLVVDGTRLRAFRERGMGDPDAKAGDGVVAAARAVSRDGDVLEGELSVDFEAGAIAGRKRFNLREFYLVEDAAGKLVWAPDLVARLRGYELLVQARLRDVLADVTEEAAKAKAPAAGHYLELTLAAGLEGDDAEKLEKRVDRLLRRPKENDPAEVKAWDARIAEARGALPALLAERAGLELEAGRRDAGLGILREALRRDPKCAPALALLETNAPKEFPLGSKRFWLDLHLDLVEAGATVASDDELELKRARFHWRKDAYGLRAGPILLITPTRDTRVVGRCLAYGKMTCDVLAQLFRTEKPHKRNDIPLVIHLFESKKEYESRSGMYDSLEDPEFLKWTAGHYSPTEGVSRFFWFDDPAVERRVASTCVHEVTHHWLREQCPRYAPSQIRRTAKAPGHWIVEGFATFIEEGIFDVDAGTWTLFNPRSRTLDYVRALAKANRLIDWKRLYGLTNADFKDLANQSDRRVVSRWMLGVRKLSERSLFYKQSAATCAFLYHGEGGKYRDQLIEYVVNCYTGNEEKLSIPTAFGLSEDELGRKVLAFADAVAQGWEPDEK